MELVLSASTQCCAADPHSAGFVDVALAVLPLSSKAFLVRGTKPSPPAVATDTGKTELAAESVA